MKIRPAKKLQGTLSLPGDKSISHRAAIMAALARGTTKIENFAPGADCASTLGCLNQLGAEVEREGDTVHVRGVGRNGFKEPAAELDCGNSGSTMRMLAGVLAGQNFTAILTGDSSLSKRPMKRIIEPLTQMGARVEAVENRAPLKIRGKDPLRAISYTLPAPSAQLKSCLLLAGLFARGRTEIVEPVPTRDHTERMLPHFGIEIKITQKPRGKHIALGGGGELRAADIKIPADISSAAFFMAAAAGIKNSGLALPELGLNPTRVTIIDTLRSFGAEIEITNQKMFAANPWAT